jgi:cobalamin biosynthesis protein CobW
VRAFSWPSVRHRVTVDGVVTVVDAAAVTAGRFAPDPQATMAAIAADPAIDHDDPIEELFEDQLRCADLVIVSKADLVSPTELADAEAIVRREARQGTGVIRGTQGRVPLHVLLGMDAAAEADMDGRESRHDRQGEEHDHDDFDSFVVDLPPLPSMEALRKRVSGALSVPGVLRIKGRAAVAGKSATAIVQAVGPRVETSFASGAVNGGLVVIGLRDMDRAAIAAALGG